MWECEELEKNDEHKNGFMKMIGRKEGKKWGKRIDNVYKIVKGKRE